MVEFLLSRECSSWVLQHVQAYAGARIRWIPGRSTVEEIEAELHAIVYGVMDRDVEALRTLTYGQVPPGLILSISGMDLVAMCIEANFDIEPVVLRGRGLDYFD